jgi:hypothetical protein
VIARRYRLFTLNPKPKGYGIRTANTINIQITKQKAINVLYKMAQPISDSQSILSLYTVFKKKPPMIKSVKTVNITCVLSRSLREETSTYSSIRIITI